MLKYFINSILQMSISGDTVENDYMYDCRLINDSYKELYRETLNEDDKNAFEKIMASDKNAILYIKHDKLKKLADFRIKYQFKQPIVDGTKWP